MSNSINTRTDGNTMFAEVEPFTPEAERNYNHERHLTEDRHEDTGIRHEAGKESRAFAARSITGSPVHDLQSADPEKTIITVQGLEMSLAQALKSGVVSRDTLGKVAEVKQSAPKAAPKTDPNASAPLFAAKTEGFNVLSKMAQTMGSFDKAENSFIRLIANRTSGKDAALAIEEIGDAVGAKTHQEATKAANALLGELSTRVADALEATGVDGMDALNHYILNHPSDAAARLVSLFRGHMVPKHLAAIRSAYLLAKSRHDAE